VHPSSTSTNHRFELWQEPSPLSRQVDRQTGLSKSGHVGLLNISPEKPLWDFPLPSPAPDNHQPQFVEVRKHPASSAIIRWRFMPKREPPLGNNSGFSVADVTLKWQSHCRGTKVKSVSGSEKTKSWADGEVAYSTPGFGTGVKFDRISEPDLERIRQCLEPRAVRKKPTYKQ